MSLTAASRRTGALAAGPKAVGRKPAEPASAASARDGISGAAAGPLAYRLALHVPHAPRLYRVRTRRLWTQPDRINTVQRTTIEALVAIVGDGKPVRFWSAQW